MKKRIIPTAALMVLLVSCDFSSPLVPPEGIGDQNPPPVEENTRLFVEGDKPGEFVFETNESGYSRPYGKSFWFPAGNTQSPFVDWGITVRKESGRTEGGFGIVICDVGTSMLTVMIRIDGYYQVAEIVKGRYIPRDVWKPHPAIVRDRGNKNRINVSRASNGVFTLRINDQKITTFVDDEAPIHTGGRQGYLVVSSPLEDFPRIPLKVIFRETGAARQ